MDALEQQTLKPDDDATTEPLDETPADDDDTAPVDDACLAKPEVMES
jgi:hypothetical protein